ncbi:MAG: ABC transporter ATP-binding protein [Capsulimonadales bacterium]|nr:ABC transporter ATP-binding protein [Capsulimonadales bacterium]
MTMAIRIDRVTRAFGETVALSEISLTIPDGQFVSLVGPSGCGKSTLLAIIAGLDPATTGRVEVGSTPGVVFQEPALFPWRNIRDNVAFGPEMQGVKKAERYSRADAALRMVHLTRFAHAFPHQLSGGMRQRAAIARALVSDPAVLLMDEPFAALDAQTRTLLQAELLTVWERTRKTVVFVTHALDEALYLSDRIILMSARPGRVLADLTVDAPRPRDPQADPALASLRAHLLALLSAEVEALARAEHDGDWQGLARPAPPATANIGAEI